LRAGATGGINGVAVTGDWLKGGAAMNLETIAIDISARMFVRGVPEQADRAVEIIKQAVERINAELPAIEARMGWLTEE
jgi:hypothetical protein